MVLQCQPTLGTFRVPSLAPPIHLLTQVSRHRDDAHERDRFVPGLARRW
jgi:hypothetical protein